MDPVEICDSDCEADKPAVAGSLTNNGKLVITVTLTDGSVSTEVRLCPM